MNNIILEFGKVPAEVTKELVITSGSLALQAGAVGAKIVAQEGAKIGLRLFAAVVDNLIRK